MVKEEESQMKIIEMIEKMIGIHQVIGEKFEKYIMRMESVTERKYIPDKTIIKISINNALWKLGGKLKMLQIQWPTKMIECFINFQFCHITDITRKKIKHKHILFFDDFI